MPRVSIAIRAFRRRWLAEAIASVLAQTYRDLELVIYDDAGDLEDLASATRDPRVRYHCADAPRSASGRFQAAVGLCRGDYVGLLDDDDAYGPDFVAALAAALDADPRAGIACGRLVWDADGVGIVPTDPRPAGRQAAALIAVLRDGIMPGTSEMLFRREAYEEALRAQPMPSGVAPDAFVVLRIALAGWAHVLVDAPVRRRWHASQVSRGYPVASDIGVATWASLHLDDAVLAALRDRRLARAHLTRAFHALLAGDVERARADVEAAEAVVETEARGRRQLIAAMAECGWLGVIGTRAWAAWSPHGRRRRRPPPHIGDA